MYENNHVHQHQETQKTSEAASIADVYILWQVLLSDISARGAYVHPRQDSSQDGRSRCRSSPEIGNPRMIAWPHPLGCCQLNGWRSGRHGAGLECGLTCPPIQHKSSISKLSQQSGRYGLNFSKVVGLCGASRYMWSRYQPPNNVCSVAQVPTIKA